MGARTGWGCQVSAAVHTPLPYRSSSRLRPNRRTQLFESCDSFGSARWLHPYRPSAFGARPSSTERGASLRFCSDGVVFGEGDAVRRTLVNAWPDAGRAHMRSVPVEGVKGARLARLEYNVPVLRHLPEAFGLVASPPPPPPGFPPIDPLPAIQHAAGVADEACRATNDASVGVRLFEWASTFTSMTCVRKPSWYTRRATPCGHLFRCR
ncbi:hypothetical protein F5148DRAFT_360342 [Russula earlei]|uniref:Uncharacterized protein n=1 Tax=Russula earlei TaxID=71964 RepID=A0ACC0UHZ5_9AGAM|nr:hypothetical protein F5148DRAFT_360342 [Russula earlei]